MKNEGRKQQNIGVSQQVLNDSKNRVKTEQIEVKGGKSRDKNKEENVEHIEEVRSGESR